jgi:hypothetical protein
MARYRLGPFVHEHGPNCGYRFTLNAPSSVGAKVNFTALQAGIG